MIISHKLKIVFIHIPKNAGTYITNLLYNIDKDCENISIDNTGHIPFFKIIKLDIYEKIKNYTFFTVIRDPIRSFISFYYYAKKYSKHYLNELINLKYYEIDIFLKNFFLPNKNHFMGNLYYIYQDENFSNINNDIVLLNFNNIDTNFAMFINSLKTINKTYLFNNQNNIINKTEYVKNDKEYELVKNIFLTDIKFKKEIDFYTKYIN